jgi:hypothetical protein
MKLAFTALMVFSLLGSFLMAEESKGTCVNGDTDTLFFTTGDMPQGPEYRDVFPEFEYSSDKVHNESLNWIKTPDGLTKKTTVIGRYQGHEIVDITYEGKLLDASYPSALFVYKVLAYRTAVGVSSSLRPFFILSGENTRWYEQVFESDKQALFGLQIFVTMPGNGVIWSAYTFVFSETSAWLKFHSEGGRKAKTKHWTFGPGGKVLDYTVDDDN